LARESREHRKCLRLRNGNDGSDAEEDENPIAGPDETSGWPPARLNPDVSEVQDSQQQKAKPGSEEPHSVGRPWRVKSESENRMH
jgi:hypothetical protein